MKRRFLQDLMTRNIGFCNTSFLFLVELTLLNWGKLRTRPLKRTLSGCVPSWRRLFTKILQPLIPRSKIHHELSEQVQSRCWWPIMINYAVASIMCR
ncbi:hypothetical protein PC118_g21482 [Phytophthora cactorum]|uniref:Uncharacterized protein n=1 Tax=Phytophthora cactorum TaxID=29920 RepID=A0A8T1EW53_9STRA|nr:hypothetical protein PC118_g21482 [Phytophthora cactorum]KAG3056130.1 hypothetical protein PC122_g21489 [Phytophthora cactorum]